MPGAVRRADTQNVPLTCAFRTVMLLVQQTGVSGAFLGTVLSYLSVVFIDKTMYLRRVSSIPR